MLRKEKHPDSQPTGTDYQHVNTLHTIWDLLEKPMTLSIFSPAIILRSFLCHYLNQVNQSNELYSMIHNLRPTYSFATTPLVIALEETPSGIGHRIEIANRRSRTVYL